MDSWASPGGEGPVRGGGEVSRSPGTQTLGLQASDCAPRTRISTTAKCEGMRLLLHFPWVPLAAEWRRELRECREATGVHQERDVQAWSRAVDRAGGGGAKMNPGGGMREGVLCVCVRVFNGKGGIGVGAGFMVGPKT